MLENIYLLAATLLFTLGLGYYLITALQWFSYKWERILLHYTKPLWHLYFAIIPFGIFAIFSTFYPNLTPIFAGLYLVALFFWQRKLDKRLVFTSRIKRFFCFLISAFLIFSYFLLNQILVLVSSLTISFLLMELYEKLLYIKFKNSAKNKLASMPDLKIVLITASFGKTSMKNFCASLLEKDFNVLKTPRSVNTLSGIIKDINENLTPKTQIYIAEAGARLKGDIKDIAQFLNPHFVIIGEIGAMHIEYFKSLENIRSTKLEALVSKNLEYAFLHSTTLKKEDEKTCIYDHKVSDISANLGGIKFKLNDTWFSSKLLGAFNAQNIAASVLLALKLGVKQDTLKMSVLNLKSVEHRLKRLDAGGKIIIDDSFNGNLKGMKQSYELVRGYSGRKILLTPGIIEADDELNEELSKSINEIFDVVVITSGINQKTLTKFLSNPEVIILKDKSKIQEFLSQNTTSGDLILFSNDAPSFV